MWAIPPERLSLDAGGLHVWRASLDLSVGVRERLDGMLTPGEKEQCGRFVRAGDRTRCAAARASLRVVLAKYVPVDPQSLPIAAEASGKPFLVSGDIHFNMSHSDDLVLIAVSRGRRVGIDIERIRGLRDMDAILDGFFSDGERASLRSRTGPERARAFFLFWTRREAAAKAIGLGIYEAFARLDLPPRDTDTTGFRVQLPLSRTVTDATAGWWMRDIHPAPGFAGALCVEEANPEPFLYSLQI